METEERRWKKKRNSDRCTSVRRNCDLPGDIKTCNKKPEGYRGARDVEGEGEDG